MRQEAQDAEREAGMLARMSPEQMAEHLARTARPKPHAPIKSGQWMLRDAIRREDQQKALREREQREREDGTLARREAQANRRQEIVDRGHADALEEEERHTAAERVIHERVAEELLKVDEVVSA